MTLDAVLTRIDADLEPALARLFALLRIPSISTDPAHAGDVRAAADWLRDDLASMGFAAAVHDTPGHPMVVGQMDGPGPHVLFYGHYDVQPVDPLSLWDRAPFDPALDETPKGRVIRARGAADDKGQLMTFLEACRAIIAQTGKLPCKVTVFLEGEEESGSPSLVPFLQDNADMLRADLALICDTGLFSDDVPAITTQLRGLLGEEIVITGPRIDLHSGMYGGIAMNPIRVLSRILAGLHDDQGRVQVPGFYDDVEELSPALKAQWAGLGFDERAFLDEVGLSHPAGEAGRTGLEMIWRAQRPRSTGSPGAIPGQASRRSCRHRPAPRCRSGWWRGKIRSSCARPSARGCVRNCRPIAVSVFTRMAPARPAGLISPIPPSRWRGAHSAKNGRARRPLSAVAAQSPLRGISRRFWGWIRSLPVSARMMMRSIARTRNTI